MRAALLGFALLAFASTAVAAEESSGDLERDVSWSRTFDSEGEFPYHCHPHPFMKGTVRVAPGGADAVEVAIEEFAYSPSNVTVRPGGTVTWTNLDEAAHTVTFEAAGAHGGHETPAPTLALLVAGVAVATLLLSRRTWGPRGR